jgi:serine/threonine protein kinase
MSVEFASGSVIGSYRVMHQIGRGGMATVYEATHTILHRRAALKVMHPELLRQPGMIKRMVNEASLFEHLRHPGLVPIYDCNFLAERRPWIAMELVLGESLASQIASHRLSAVEVSHLLASVADVLEMVHANGIVHRDLKPDNVLLTPRDRDFPLRVIDWGVARRASVGRLTLEGLTPGTPIYMSPEQATGRDLSGSCDIFALGVTAFEALTGRPPFDGRNLAEVVAMQLGAPPSLRDRCKAPEEMYRLVHEMLDLDPTFRPTALEVGRRARELVRALGGEYESYELRGDVATLSQMESGETEQVPIVANG